MSDYRAPQPKRHKVPTLIWGLLGIMVVALFVLILGILRNAPAHAAEAAAAQVEGFA